MSRDMMCFQGEMTVEPYNQQLWQYNEYTGISQQAVTGRSNCSPQFRTFPTISVDLKNGSLYISKNKSSWPRVSGWKTSSKNVSTHWFNGLFTGTPLYHILYIYICIYLSISLPYISIYFIGTKILLSLWRSLPFRDSRQRPGDSDPSAEARQAKERRAQEEEALKASQGGARGGSQDLSTSRWWDFYFWPFRNSNSSTKNYR